MVLVSQFACASKSLPTSQEQEIRTFRRNSPLPQTELNRTSEVLVWNIKKGQEDSFEEDFKNLSEGKDLILLQEFLDTATVTQTLLDQNVHEYHLGVSFIYDEKVPQEATGVAIGSVAPPVDTVLFRTPAREPFLGTPKVTLCNTFKITHSNQPLLVCNIHGYNFTNDEDFEKQIEMITPLLQTHLGPILFGGDFNTNNENKWKILEKLVIEDSDLTPVDFSPDARKPASSWLFWHADLPIDHIFTKGLMVTAGRVWKDIEGSDHNPLSITITVVD
jgi:endonuclease/exonuclease/phosphatase (EEP) superfamily protein YafD